MIGQIPARCRSATIFGPVCYLDTVIEFGLKGVLCAANARVSQSCAQFYLLHQLQRTCMDRFC